jgi:hypothetical protein
MNICFVPYWRNLFSPKLPAHLRNLPEYVDPSAMQYPISRRQLIRERLPLLERNQEEIQIDLASHVETASLAMRPQLFHNSLRLPVTIYRALAYSLRRYARSC